MVVHFLSAQTDHQHDQAGQHHQDRQQDRQNWDHLISVHDGGSGLRAQNQRAAASNDVCALKNAGLAETGAFVLSKNCRAGDQLSFIIATFSAFSASERSFQLPTHISQQKPMVWPL